MFVDHCLEVRFTEKKSCSGTKGFKEVVETLTVGWCWSRGPKLTKSSANQLFETGWWLSPRNLFKLFSYHFFWGEGNILPIWDFVWWKMLFTRSEVDSFTSIYFANLTWDINKTSTKQPTFQVCCDSAQSELQSPNRFSLVSKTAPKILFRKCRKVCIGKGKNVGFRSLRKKTSSFPGCFLKKYG